VNLSSWFQDRRTRWAFIRSYCQRSNASWRSLRKRRVVVRCKCGDESCQGWAMIPRDALVQDIELGFHAFAVVAGG